MTKKKKSKLNNAKAASWASLPWSKVHVNHDDQRENNESKFEQTSNHYDDNSGKSADPADLYDLSSTNGPDYVEGANEPGIFLGLEVIDGSQYSVEKIPVINPVTKKGTGGYVTKLVVKEDTNSPESQPQDKTDVEPSKKKEVTVQRKRKRSATDTDGGRERKSDLVHVTQEEIEMIRDVWSNATGGVYLHPKLCRSLHRLGFASPTPIQSNTLAASILGQRDIVGAAPTGSGKTLSYLLPILHTLLTDKEEENEEDGSFRQYPLRALILCPTRELAMQVSMEFSKLIKSTLDDDLSPDSADIKCGTIVGGLSEHKQKRVLDVKRPPVIVATPGRLWDLMSSGDHSHLENLTKLQFLVVDEADRMISQGSFPQLEQIFEKIQRANPSLEYLAAHADDQDDSDDSYNDGRLRSLPGIRGEAKVQMLDDNILEMIQRQRSEMTAVSGEKSTGDLSVSDESVEGEDNEEDVDDEECEAEQNVESTDDEIDNDKKDIPVKRQTFVFSATLTLPSLKMDRSRDNRLNNRKKGKQSVNGAIAEIMVKIGAQGIAKVVDLSTSEAPFHRTSSSIQTPNDDLRLVQLPAGLSLFEIRCTQKHKDSHLYSFLTTTKQGSSGPCLVFCNSISGVKRIYETLKVLKLPVRMLHSQMQQKARLSSLESLTGSNCRSVVIATDVAARGLDIPAVSTVVHYDVARAVDTFVHRAGRTARGVGEKAVGWSVSLVSASEEKTHQTICRAVRGEGTTLFTTAPIDGRLLANAQERVNLASKIVACEHVDSRTKKNNQWFVDAAKDAEIELDSELLEDGQFEGSNKERQQYLDAKRARHELNLLLSKPMRKQMFGKFLSNAGMSESVLSENDIKPYVAPNTDQGRRKSTKRRAKK